MISKRSQLLDTLALYELVLSLGGGLDFEEDISNFLLLLLQKKSLDYVSLWLYETKEEKSDTEIRLLFSHPNNYIKDFRSTSTQIVINKLRNAETIQVILSKESKDLVPENLPPHGVIAYIPLGSLGFLKIFDAQRSEFFEEGELQQLAPIFKKFSTSLSAAIVYQQYKNQLKEKSHYANRLRTMVDAALDAFIIINAHGKILEWNQQAQNIFGWSQAEVLGKQLEDFIIPHDYCDTHKTLIKSLMRPGNTETLKQRIEIIVLKKSGQPFPIELSIVPVKTNSGYIFCGYVRDITLLKKEEEKQKQLMDKLELVNHDLLDFAHVVSHDLKAPLRAIKNLSDWISADYEEKLGADGQQQFELLKSRVDRMRDLINGILEYSKLGRLNSEEKVVDLGQVVKELIDTLDPPQHIHLSMKGKMPAILINEVSIRQVFQNLVSNAIKYIDKPEGKIEVGYKEELDRLCFWVKDNGPGIAKKDQERVFKIFETLGNSKSYESTGVGLSIVKKILSNYEGNIWLDSTMGEGSCFYFSLPKTRLTLPIGKRG